MTEAEWLACTDSNLMVQFLQKGANHRKLRLFACACCRKLLPLIPDAHARRAIKVAERCADGELPPEKLRYAWESARRAEGADRRRRNAPTAQSHALWAVTLALEENLKGLIWLGGTVRWAVDEANRRGLAPEITLSDVALVRCVFGNPFHPVAIDSAWLGWNGGTIPKLALAIYEERAFDRLPVLADALEEAGCTDAAILDHCRQPGEHVRGCWVIDLLLGKA